MDSLNGIRIVACTANIPGPAACRRLADLGASVLKVEPPGGDALEQVAAAYYARLNAGFEVLRLDLKNPEDREQLDTRIADADLWLNTVRPAALAALGLDPETLQSRYPTLCQTMIVGDAPPHADRPGHDLNYQAAHGLVSPPDLPTTLLADLAGAERAVTTALALLFRRERTGAGGFAYVPLAEAARELAAPLACGLTAPGGLLAGALPVYRCYRCADGRWIACGMLEEKFVRTFMAKAGLDEFSDTVFSEFFAQHPADHWVDWARDLDLPISLVRVPGESTTGRDGPPVGPAAE